MVDLDEVACKMCQEHLPEWNTGVYEGIISKNKITIPSYTPVFHSGAKCVKSTFPNGTQAYTKVIFHVLIQISARHARIRLPSYSYGICTHMHRYDFKEPTIVATPYPCKHSVTLIQNFHPHAPNSVDVRENSV